MTHNVGVAGVRGSTVPVRPAQGRSHLSPAAVSSPAMPITAYLLWRDCGFTHTQAAALARGGYVALGWMRVA